MTLSSFDYMKLKHQLGLKCDQVLAVSFMVALEGT